MGKHRIKPNYRRRVLRLPDLDHCKLTVLKHAAGDSMRAKRDYAMLAMLFGCGFRRSELVGLELDEIQMRQGHWAVVDLIGKGETSAPSPFQNGSKPRSISGRSRPGSRREGSFEPSPRREKCGGKASRRMSCGT
jgi:integrase